MWEPTGSHQPGHIQHKQSWMFEYKIQSLQRFYCVLLSTKPQEQAKDIVIQMLDPVACL